MDILKFGLTVKHTKFEKNLPYGFDKSAYLLSKRSKCVRDLDLRVQVHPGELWVSKQQVHIVLDRSLKISGYKR